MCVSYTVVQTKLNMITGQLLVIVDFASSLNIKRLHVFIFITLRSEIEMKNKSVAPFLIITCTVINTCD